MDSENQQYKKFYRSQTNRYIGGVCGGLTDYFNVDANLFRILFILFSFIGGLGIIIYIISMIIVPVNPNEEKIKNRIENDRTIFWALLLIAIGALLLVKEFGVFNYFHFWHLPWSSLWAIFLILIGLLLIFSSSRKVPIEKDGGQPSESTSVLNEIHRSRSDRMLAGVCAGIANYFKIDPSIVRLLWVLASLASVGLGILVYVVLIFVIPEQTEQSESN